MMLLSKAEPAVDLFVPNSRMGKEEPWMPARKSDYCSAVLTRYRTQAEVPFEAANALLTEHARLMHRRMIEGGGPDFDIAPHIDNFWSKFQEVLPPVGSYYLAWSKAGQLIGTGALRTVSPGVGEMKHLYVRPEARGMGLGRALVEARIADARAMGLRTLLADTFAANAEMPALYDKMGFQRVAPIQAGSTAGISPQLVAHMLFFEMTL
jgi:GNAT superfamily N-acetyltransferase